MIIDRVRIAGYVSQTLVRLVTLLIDVNVQQVMMEDSASVSEE